MSVFHKEVVKRKETAKDVLEKAFLVAYFLAKEHVAIKKFLNLIKFAEYSLGVYLKYFNRKSEGSIREIFLVLVETMKEEIVHSAQKVQSYGLMVDEVTDIAVQSQILTFIQFVSPVTSCIETAFLSVQNVLEEFESANADGLTSLIKDELQQCGLSLTNLKGLATDEAAVMTGRNNGVATKLKELNPVLISVQCICHKLALACTDTNKEINDIKRVEDILRQLWAYFENSPKRLAVLLKMQITIKKCSLQLKDKSKQLLVKRIKKACSTRWLIPLGVD